MCAASAKRPTLVRQTRLSCCAPSTVSSTKRPARASSTPTRPPTGSLRWPSAPPLSEPPPVVQAGGSVVHAAAQFTRRRSSRGGASGDNRQHRLLKRVPRVGAPALDLLVGLRNRADGGGHTRGRPPP